AREQIVALGGVLTSSGGLRAVTEPATPGGSKPSLHYTARAIDLHIYSGMQAGQTPYIVLLDGGTADRPFWKVYCDVGDAESPEAGDPVEWQALAWKKDRGYVVVPRRARCVCLTDLLAEHGWRRIPARAD